MKNAQEYLSGSRLFWRLRSCVHGQHSDSTGQICACRHHDLPIVGNQAGVASCAEAQRCNGAPSGRGRYIGHRIVARS